jgi:hypothetical protein
MYLANIRAAAAHEELLRSAHISRSLGSPFVANVLEAAYSQILRAPRTAIMMADWPGDLAAAALSMRLNGALHALARRGKIAKLAALYRCEHQDFEGAIGEALAIGDDFIAEWMQHPTQTNEVGRAASLIAALMVAQTTTRCQFELLELGSSCGLNLNLGHYSYDLGGVRVGRANSSVLIAPRWEGAPPPVAPVEIVAARGTDLRPLDPSDDATRERLLSFVWADQTARAQRLERALDIARDYRPWIDRENAVDWLTERLNAPQQEGVCRVVMHSMVLQYLDEAGRRTVERAIREAGTQATEQRPLAGIAFEWTRDRSEVHLLLTCWPDGRTRHLATCHPYGDWVRWHG